MSPMQEIQTLKSIIEKQTATIDSLRETLGQASAVIDILTGELETLTGKSFAATKRQFIAKKPQQVRRTAPIILSVKESAAERLFNQLANSGAK